MKGGVLFNNLEFSLFNFLSTGVLEYNIFICESIDAETVYSTLRANPGVSLDKGRRYINKRHDLIKEKKVF